MSEESRVNRERRSLSQRVPAYSRFVVGVPVVGLFIGSVTLVGLAAVEVARTVVHALQGELAKKEAILEFIELADVFLLATVLYIMSMGLYELFIDPDVAVPSWLEIHDLDDLKEKLVGVVIVVLAVLFLGQVIGEADPLSLALKGGGVAAVIASLAYFLGKIGKHKI